MVRSERVSQLLTEFDGSRPLSHATAIPPSWYVDPEFAAFEREQIFGRGWHYVAPLDRLASVGDCWPHQLADEPILLTRSSPEHVTACSNVCRHRAAVLVDQPCRGADKIRCRYHGWTYDLAGNLRGVPEFDGVADFQREAHSLPSFSCESFGSMVFVGLDQSKRHATTASQAEPALGQLTAGLAELGVAPMFAGLAHVERKTYRLACNWKVFVDNYLDGGYHVHSVHPGLASVLDYSGYHTRLFEWSNVQVSPMKKPGDEHEQIATVRSGEQALYWWVFPNLMINCYSGVIDTNLVLPIDPDHCLVHFDFFYPKEMLTSDSDKVHASILASDQIQQEDIGICEDVQRGMRSRFYRPGRFSVRREAGGFQFHQLLARQLQVT